ncbi:MAG: glycosyltransferase family 2 protein [Bacteroidota bacterium]
MKFSVVIAAYNASRTICAALQSCMSQTYAAFEIIVVDDASTDDTIQLVQAFSPEIRTISLKENKGVSAARNAGWAMASGDYVAFLDSDDSWHPEKLFRVSETLKDFPAIKFLAHQFAIGTDVSESKFSSAIIKEVHFGELLIRNQIQGSCIVVKKDMMQRFDEQMRYTEDYDFALRCAYQQAIVFLEIPLSILSRPQQSAGGLSANRWAMRKGELYLYGKLWKLNPLLLLCIPVLWLYSLAKHLFQKAK